jgi:hypothetical protein
MKEKMKRERKAKRRRVKGEDEESEGTMRHQGLKEKEGG